MKRTVVAAIALMVSTPAYANWTKATSDHFIVYSDGSKSELKETVERLEKFDFVVRLILGAQKEQSPIKLKIYRVYNMTAVEDTLAFGGYGVAGYYSSNLRGPYAIATRRGFDSQSAGSRIDTSDATDVGMEVLQHEYAHHVMYHYFPGGYPSWYSEGFAEFFGSMQFHDNNVVEVGHIPDGRMQTISRSWLSMDEMLAAKSYADVGSQILSLYAQGWLLVHFTALHPERRTQLQAYLDAIAAGKSYEEAAKIGFGEELGELDSELRAHSRKIQALRLSFREFDVGPIEVEELSDAESDMVEHDMRLFSGVPADDVDLFVSAVRSDAAQYPDLLYAQRLLMEAEQLAGNTDRSVAVAREILAEHPDHALAKLYVAQQKIAQLKAAGSTTEAEWDDARALILEANKLEPNNAEILTAYYDSFLDQGVTPPAAAQNALFSAHRLIPSNEMLRYRVAKDFENRGMIHQAIDTIKPEAYASHELTEEEANEREKQLEKYRLAGQVNTETAREMLERLEEKLAAKQDESGEKTGTNS